MSKVDLVRPLSPWGYEHLGVKAVSRFRYDRLIDRGADADIFLEVVDDKQLAIKVAAPTEPGETSSYSGDYGGPNLKNCLLEREGVLLPLLHCDHIVQAHGCWTQGGKWHLALDKYYCSLDDLIRHNRPNPIRLGLALYFCEAMGKALAFLHRGDLVHCDVKPANFLVDPDIAYGTTLPRAVLGDLSYTRSHHTPLPSETNGYMIGTPAYMAPELISGDEVSPFYRDLFAVGAALYEMVGGNLKKASDASQVLSDRKEVRDAMMKGWGVPPRIRQLVRILADPTGRIQNGMQLSAHLRRYYRWYVREAECQPDVWKNLFPPPRDFN